MTHKPRPPADPGRFKRRREEEPGYDLLFGEMWEGGDRDLWNLLDPTVKRWTPFNDHLLEVFQLWLADIFSTQQILRSNMEWLELLVGILMTVRRANKEHLSLTLEEKGGQRNFVWSAIGRVAWRSENQEPLLNRMTRDPTAQALLDAGFAAGDRELLDLLDRNFRMVMDNRRW